MIKARRILNTVSALPENAEENKAGKVITHVYRPVRALNLISDERRREVKEGKKKVDQPAIGLIPILNDLCDGATTSNAVKVVDTEDEEVVFSDSDESLAQSDIVKGMKVKIPSNPRNLAEFGVSPRNISQPLLNFSAFDRQDLKAMFQKNLEDITERLNGKQRSVYVSPPSMVQPVKKKRGCKKKIRKKGGKQAQTSLFIQISMISALFGILEVLQMPLLLLDLKKLIQVHQVSFVAISEPMIDKDTLLSVRLQLDFDFAVSNDCSSIWVF